MTRRPIVPFQAHDGFGRANQAALGTATSGEAWQHYVTPPTATREETTQAVFSSKGRIFFPVRSAAKREPRHYYARLGTRNDDEAEVLALFSSSAPTVSYIGAALQITTTGYVSASLDRNQLRLIRMTNNGTFTALTQTTVPFTVAAGDKFWIRFQYHKGTNRYNAKVWAFGATEPAGWTLSAPGSGVVKGGAGIALRGIDQTAYYGEVHKVFTYGMDAGDTETRTYPHAATFPAAYSALDWGVSTRGNLWQGNYIGSDPAVTGTAYTMERQPVGVPGPYGHVTSTTNTGSYWYAYQSAATAKDASALAQFRWVGTATAARYGVGLRGTANADKSVTGYFAEVLKDSTTIRIMNGGTVLATGTLPFTATQTLTMWLRFEVVGTTLRARAWRDVDAEPATWQVTTTHTARTGGVFFLCGLDNLAGTRYVTWAASVSTILTAANHTTTQPTSYPVTHLTDTSVSIALTYLDDANANNAFVVQHRPTSGGAWKTAKVAINRGTKTATATLTGMAPNADNTVRFTVTDPDGVAGTNPYSRTFPTQANGYYHESTIVTASASSLTATVVGTSATAANTTMTMRTRRDGTATWSAPIALARVTNGDIQTFTGNRTGLLPDTTYWVEITVANAKGVFGTPTKITQSVTTLGKSIELQAIGASATATSAVVTVSYLYDTNDNATCSFRYRSLQDRLYTTLNASSVAVDRENRQVRATLTGLRAEMTYEVIVDATDPDGILPGVPTRLRTTFVTTTGTPGFAPEIKQHVYRVYDIDGGFLGTWPDAPDPEFSWDMNGGVTDLSVRLPRTFTSIDGDRTIEHNNRVDVWCIDGDSRGMGRNLIKDPDGQRGGWVLPVGSGWSVRATGGPDGGPCLRFGSGLTTVQQIRSEVVELPHIVPLTVSALARVTGGKLRLDIAAYDATDTLIDAADDNAETVGTEWQRLTLDYLPPKGTATVRVRVENVGKGAMVISRVALLAKEHLVYRGFIEAFEPSIDADAEHVTVQVLGVASQLSDDYIDFLQYTDVQSTRDLNEGRVKERRDPVDPSVMLKQIIDTARKQNPRFQLYYTAESIRTTGISPLPKYTFRNKLLRDCFDKVRALCPPGWHYVIDPDGLVSLLGPEHVQTHHLRLKVEINAYSSNRSIRNLKNVVKFKGRQDSDNSEPDGHGSINYIAQDTASIREHGRRVTHINDAQVTDPQTAEIIAEGRLEELNKIEEAGEAQVPDEKDLRTVDGSLRGYNVQSLRPGDFVRVIDPDTGPNMTLWDQFDWNEADWGGETHRLLKEPVPIVAVRYYGDSAVIELSQRPPQARGDFARMLAVMRKNDTED